MSTLTTFGALLRAHFPADELEPWREPTPEERAEELARLDALDAEEAALRARQDAEEAAEEAARGQL